MNSTLLSANFHNYYTSLTKNQQEQLVYWSTAYHFANQKGNPTELRNAYTNLLTVVQQGEQASGIQLLQSPDGNFMYALASLSSSIHQGVNHPQTVTFSSIEEAHNWLQSQYRIILTAVNIKTRTRFGLFANHTEAEQVSITYRSSLTPTAGRYGICEEEQTKLFLKGNYENYSAKWEKVNPDFNVVFVQHAVNSRGSVPSVAFGFGLDYVEHAKFFVTYQEKFRSLPAR